MYAQKMSNEIRNLEDQLYDADYQNRVLRDRLEACQNQNDCDPESTNPASTSESGFRGSRTSRGSDVGSGLAPTIMPEPPMDIRSSGPGSASDRIDVPTYDAMEQGLGTEAFDAGEFGMVEIDAGEVVSPDEAIEPSDLKSSDLKSSDLKSSDLKSKEPLSGVESSTGAFATQKNARGDATQEGSLPLQDPPLKEVRKDSERIESSQAKKNTETGDSETESLPFLPPDSKSSQTESRETTKPKTTAPKPDAFLLPPAPTEPQPPGKRDLIAPPLIPGEIVPPPAEPDAEDIPPGKIELPESLGDNSPVDIEIHPSFSGGIPDETGKVEEMNIVLNAIDASGKPVDLENFDIQADLTIIVMDPELPVGKDKLGRWDFTPAQTATMVRSSPVSGFHVPIRWGDLRPTSDEVVVHARLRSDGQLLNCYGRVGLQKVAQVSSVWTPRAK
jgi:hypothetical protein